MVHVTTNDLRMSILQTQVTDLMKAVTAIKTQLNRIEQTINVGLNTESIIDHSTTNDCSNPSTGMNDYDSKELLAELPDPTNQHVPTSTPKGSYVLIECSDSDDFDEYRSQLNTEPDRVLDESDYSDSEEQFHSPRRYRSKAVCVRRIA